MPISTTTQTSYVKNLTTWPTGVLSNGVKIDGPFSWTGNSNTSYTVKYSTLPSLSWASGGVKDYLFYGRKEVDDTDPPIVSLCSRTRSLNEAIADLNWLKIIIRKKNNDV